MQGNFACFLVVCGFIFKIIFFFFFFFFFKKLSGIPSEYQTVWIQIRPDILSGLIWVQTVCKSNQQTTKVATSGERVKLLISREKKNCFLSSFSTDRSKVVPLLHSLFMCRWFNMWCLFRHCLFLISPVLLCFVIAAFP